MSHSSAHSVVSVCSSGRALRNRLDTQALRTHEGLRFDRRETRVPGGFEVATRGCVSTSLGQALWFTFISLFCLGSSSEPCVAKRS